MDKGSNRKFQIEKSLPNRVASWHIFKKIPIWIYLEGLAIEVVGIFCDPLE
jgi:hypothetical protein